MHKRYASYHWHILSTLAQRHCAAPTFQAQCALVQAFDSALDLLEREPSFQQLTVAGGCAVLEDYLRLRPEHFERLETAVQRAALHINPFYALPEPSLHTPEGLVRNLLRGTACADVFGGAMPVALFLEAEMLPAWLPQVLRGFKLSAVLAHTPSAQPLEQLWQGDDGTRVPLAYVHELCDQQCAGRRSRCAGAALPERTLSRAVSLVAAERRVVARLAEQFHAPSQNGHRAAQRASGLCARCAAQRCRCNSAWRARVL
jgi:hypothetical protein